jgi:hypothetical protein
MRFRPGPPRDEQPGARPQPLKVSARPRAASHPLGRRRSPGVRESGVAGDAPASRDQLSPKGYRSAGSRSPLMPTLMPTPAQFPATPRSPVQRALTPCMPVRNHATSVYDFKIAAFDRSATPPASEAPQTKRRYALWSTVSRESHCSTKKMAFSAEYGTMKRQSIRVCSSHSITLRQLPSWENTSSL